jgi:ABC-type uncharacterized transport system auxiliary subunit
MKYTLITALALMLLFSGCLSEKSAITRHYTIEWTGERKEAGSAANPLIAGRCEIDPVEVHPLYEKTQIVNRSDSHEVTYYKYHQWAIRPSVAVMEVVRAYLVDAGMFESVSARYSRNIPDYRFSTTIRQLEVIESKHQFQAHLDIEFRIISNGDGRILMEHRADRTGTLDKKELNLFASAVSNMLVSELNTFEEMIRERSAEFVTEGSR